MKTLTLHLKGMIVFGAAAVVMLAAAVSQAQALKVVPPPMSYAKGQQYKNNPVAWNKFLAQLPHRTLDANTAEQAAPAASFGGTWTKVRTNTDPGVAYDGLSNPRLMIDGTVLFQEAGTQYFWKLTPDSKGNYADGTWTQVASLPVIGGTQYSPLYFASGVLPDGKVIIAGGEYQDFVPTWTNMGAIYDPVADAWTAVAPPAGWGYSSNGDGVIGDSESIVLNDGTFMLAGCCNYPDTTTGNALLDESSLTWTFTGAPSAGGLYQDEQGYNLLPNGNVLTIDIWTYYPKNKNATNAEQYDYATGVWISAGNTPVSLPDPAVCQTFEIGPAVMRPDGTLLAFGGHSGCNSNPKADLDPTAIYDTVTGIWTRGKNIPAVCGSGTTACDLADAPAATLPNGNVLFAASSGYGDNPTHFFEYTAAGDIKQVADTLLYASESGAYYYNFLVLPTGQVLTTDFSNTPEVYTPTGSANAAWAPVISQINGAPPKNLTAGDTYTLSGTQFNGLTQGAAYGDDEQGATNYPVVRLTNNSTHKVYYCRAANPNTASIAPGAATSVSFTVPQTIELGYAELAVIANGIASAGVQVFVE
jgi:hypothetical protein